ncbi:hypothetical protein J6590_054922 [Homalodisca vitripennis]|nr:hypothetical protein J6590_054922 [Homalodisca vitripennis]
MCLIEAMTHGGPDINLAASAARLQRLAAQSVIIASHGVNGRHRFLPTVTTAAHSAGHSFGTKAGSHDCTQLHR